MKKSPPPPLEHLLARFGTCADEVPLWAALVDHLRPRRATDGAAASERLRTLGQALTRNPELRLRLQGAFGRLFQERKQVSLYVSSGLLPSTGFFSETARRISHRLLPEVVDTSYMKDLLGALFPRGDDEVWVNAIPDDEWAAFLHLLLTPGDSGAEADAADDLPGALTEIVEALRVLSYHVSAIGLDPELVRIEPDLEEHESPFLAQNAELVAYLAHFRAWWRDPQTALEDERQLVVMLDQCREVMQRIRRRAAKIGTSLTLTFKLERLRQHLERIAELLAILSDMHAERRAVALAPRIVALFKKLVSAECRKNRLSDYWRQNVELLSLRMTESARRTGEHYITTTAREYLGMLGSAAMGGVVIALMAALKIVLARQGLAPLTEALGFCLNYGIGFVLIHLLGGTVATKQPAMTANTIAASIGEARGSTRDLESLAELIVRTIRSQLAAIVGNIGTAIPVAVLLSLAIGHLGGAGFIDEHKARYLLDQVNPASGALFFAAIAGLCLFLAGLIAGFYDNLSAYNRIPQRLLQLRWPRRLLGEARMRRVVDYVETNLGALAGNLCFGFLLGGVTACGVLFGLPVDIRHIAFSAAYVGYAMVGLDFHVGGSALALAAVGVAGIGLVNLLVSFSLTLAVAMRARKISFAQERSLVVRLLWRLVTRPLDFIIPPRLKSGDDPAQPSAPPPTEPAVDLAVATPPKPRTLGRRRTSS